ncbi:MAG TPA: hypothetical protein VME42_11685 [Steroidobacteraceae bacterium]|nr:hypothetical protein [Steroidobacteraceae bacterium]
MRTMWWVGTMLVAAALPVCAQARAPLPSPGFLSGHAGFSDAAGTRDYAAIVNRIDLRPWDPRAGGLRPLMDVGSVAGSVAVRATTPAGTAITTAPEVSPAFAASALTLLLGGVAVLRSRRSRMRV